MKQMHYSFDIFDTCLVRACGSPQMVFSLVAQQLGNGRAFVADFVKRRIQAELEAQARLKKEAVTIEEIYDYVDLNDLNLNKSQIIDLEMLVEEQLLCPVYSMLEQVKDLHSAGHSVLYVSDMYLPASFLEKILSKYGFWQNGDRLFVSGEHGLTKHTGALYRYISKELNIPFSSWQHYGDNAYSDVKVPRRLGIKAHKVKNNYSRYEKQWIKSAMSSFDSEMCQYFAGCARAVRLSNKTDDKISLAADVIAPAYIPFVFHVLNDAKERGITRLFFTARDSYLFYKIALQLSHLFPEVQLSYIYLSRRALWLPSLYSYNRDDYKVSMEHTIVGGTPERILRNYLNTPISEISAYVAVPQSFWQTPLTKDTVTVFYNILLHPTVRGIIAQRSLQAKELLLAYLKQEQLLNDTAHAAIVDLGWAGSGRSALNKILIEEGYDAVYTYYWGVALKRVLYSYKNPYDTYILVEELPSFKLQGIAPIGENYFSATTQHSTIGYVNSKNVIEVVFESGDGTPANMVEIAEVNLKIMNQMVNLLMYFPHTKDRIKDSFSICGLLSLRIFFTNPSYSEARLFKKVQCKDPVMHDNDSFIVQSLSLWDIVALVLLDVTKKNCWRVGSLVAMSPLYGCLLNNIRQYVLSLSFMIKLRNKLKNEVFISNAHFGKIGRGSTLASLAKGANIS
jgi:FMN phosphatase YigB (HAD superfamily)